MQRDQLLRGQRGLDRFLVSARGFDEDFPLSVEIRVRHIDFEQEAVELRFWQRIGAFLLNRVLRREYVERRWQIIANTGHRNMLFLHRLQQRRLRAR